ncbi:uncharacterized protein LOC130920020 isoform X3 [Corythoichthys intestinalis]|uniref:uncharacterized protein LOC130920020 isoform X3 n=1 Tax=Corythoichthys intestinalis TaxID=161448 RepID=UPI0025A553F6|nr:uncharacterized protein LOC130920020 isoform X3 [Corythoichthys intestinalis]
MSKILRNWRNFLRLAGREFQIETWTTKTVAHNKQQNNSSCGVFTLKFAEEYMANGDLRHNQTHLPEVLKARGDLACALLQAGSLRCLFELKKCLKTYLVSSPHIIELLIALNVTIYFQRHPKNRSEDLLLRFILSCHH